MRNIDQLIREIIPSKTRENREGFTNTDLVEGLIRDEFLAVEKRLIDMLRKDADLLIGQTLVAMQSLAALPILKEHLNQKTSHFDKISWAALIYELKKGDSEMEKVAFEEFEKIEFIYGVDGYIFRELIKFNSARINNKIEEFVDHKYDLVALNAKFVLSNRGKNDIQ